MSTPPLTRNPGPAAGALLEVVVLHPRDVAGADQGGADRLLLLDDPESGGRSPEPGVVSSVCKETDVPVRVMLRLSDSLTTTGGELARLVGLAQSYLGVGAQGVAFGFLDAELGIDVEVCTHLADRLDPVPWSFQRVFDDTLETDRAWRDVAYLPGLDTVMSAGSVRGLDEGHEELIDRAQASPRVAELLMASGGLRAEQVPWLVGAGVRQFQVASSVRPGGSWERAYVDAGHVRAWRMLIDDSVGRGRSAG